MKAKLPHKDYSILKTSDDSFTLMCRRLIGMIPTRGIPLRLVFFGSPENNDQYLSQLAEIELTIKESYPDRQPVVTYVAQKPLTSSLKLEVATLNDPDFTVSYRDTAGVKYITVENEYWSEIITGGVIASDINTGIAAQSAEVFKKVEAILTDCGMTVEDIVRQWNYIERIVDFDGEHQHYQAFNDARSTFYAKGDWHNGYPAATGIGTQHGGVVVEFNAMKTKDIENIALDNALQVAAHAYSQEVLLGEALAEKKTTPKFERGRALICKGKARVFISGTAAIRGEESLEGLDMLSQIHTTMENIEYLVSAKNISACGGCSPEAEKPKYQFLRVYIKNSDDCAVAHRYMDNHYPYIPTSYLLADVCRDELLVEIEGVAEY